MALSGAACGGSTPGADSAADTGGLVGNPAPEFHVKPVTGSKDPISLKELRGQVVLLDFWGTFCEPCKKSFPKLEAPTRKYAVSGLTRHRHQRGRRRGQGQDPRLRRDVRREVLPRVGRRQVDRQEYKPETMPSSFLIGKDGIVRFAHVGFHDGEELQVDKEIRDLLAR